MLKINFQEEANEEAAENGTFELQPPPTPKRQRTANELDEQAEEGEEEAPDGTPKSSAPGENIFESESNHLLQDPKP